MLLYIFTSNTVLTPTRELIYWSINTEHDTFKNLVVLSNYQRDYWLKGLYNDNLWQTDVMRHIITEGNPIIYPILYDMF